MPQAARLRKPIGNSPYRYGCHEIVSDPSDTASGFDDDVGERVEIVPRLDLRLFVGFAVIEPHAVADLIEQADDSDETPRLW